MAKICIEDVFPQASLRTGQGSVGTHALGVFVLADDADVLRCGRDSFDGRCWSTSPD